MSIEEPIEHSSSEEGQLIDRSAPHQKVVVTKEFAAEADTKPATVYRALRVLSDVGGMMRM